MSIDTGVYLKRNTPTLINAVFQTRQFYDSRKPVLEFQVRDVVHNPHEMGGSLDQSVNLFKKDKEYAGLFREAYPGENDPITPFTIANSLASYVRSLQAVYTRFDRYMRKESVLYSPQEIRGFYIFMGKAKCGSCHFMPLFNGLVPPMFNETESEVLGIPADKGRHPRADPDSGEYYYTHAAVQLFSFKTLTLRNIALTAPYMHNGLFATLEEVVDFYDKGGGHGLGIVPPSITLPPDQLRLSRAEKRRHLLRSGIL
jgi:cytochrome c peroxidase